ncbi:MAG: Ig-like domain-containing protein [Patescibacteria group bacterium]|nr:Ig-like domain-containing protein [Patescibacteria group bacterium]
MEKRFAGIMVGILLVVLNFGMAVGAVHTRSTYTMITLSNITVLPTNGEETRLPVMVVNAIDWSIVPGRTVHCIFQEFWEGELDSFGVTQSINVGEDGYARIPVPSSSQAKFRYATLWVGGDEASVENKMFWYTHDLSMPAKIVPVDVTAELVLGEVRDYIYQVLNAWGDVIPNVQVRVIRGNGYVTSQQTMITDSFGEVAFEVTAPSGSTGTAELRVQVEPLRFIQTAMMFGWNVGTSPPSPTLPSGSFSASSTNLSSGECATLTLTTSNTTSVSLTPSTGATGSFTSSGGTVTVCPTATTTYTVTLTGSGGQKTYSVTITVGSAPPSTGVATIEASNATSYDGTLPVFDLSIGQTFSATFVAKDSSGNPVSGVSLSVLYPNEVLTTDSSGQVTVTIPASSFEGWDSDKIWVTSDSNVFLEFKIIYQ